eukprot:TRINITY_DN2240_c0_g1_i1.p1 TRINITY_DN2240_c0_g1~~TRINITY_DN2240_c0_g1_i1.p1  ORF type:complete len:260 (+),score=26.91 TRINITY_DN2240_c0_g1_i1:270-1049(+)
MYRRVKIIQLIQTKIFPTQFRTRFESITSQGKASQLQLKLAQKSIKRDTHPYSLYRIPTKNQRHSGELSIRTDKEAHVETKQSLFKTEGNEAEGEQAGCDEEDQDYSSSEIAQMGQQGYLRIDVIDTGIGMTPEELQKLFSPFIQANSSVKGQFGGTGLGLWITKQIIESMKGDIKVESVVGKGTRFRVHIPATITHVASYKVNQDKSKSASPLIAPLMQCSADPEIQPLQRRRLTSKKAVFSEFCFLVVEPNDVCLKM